ncbi:MAG: DUF5058 family protein, partial [Pyramidobacter sp.]|nr:DUF5058 family protein [Pyramidobacter sp.]
MFNNMPMFVMCAAAMLIVILQPLVFFKMSWKRARDLGILPENLKGVV